MNCCSRLPLDLHVAQHFPLALVQRTQLLALQQFDVAIQNRQGRFQIVGGRAQRVGGALKALLQLGVGLQQIRRI